MSKKSNDSHKHPPRIVPKILTLDPSASLLSASAQTLLRSFEETLADIEAKRFRQDAVVVHQFGNANEYNQAWLEELHREALRSVLFERAFRLFSLFARIRNSRVPWFYIQEGDCLGSFWALALSCRSRIAGSDRFRSGALEQGSGFFFPLFANRSPELKRFQDLFRLEERSYNLAGTESGEIEKDASPPWDLIVSGLKPSTFTDILSLRRFEPIFSDDQTMLKGLDERLGGSAGSPVPLAISAKSTDSNTQNSSEEAFRKPFLRAWKSLARSEKDFLPQIADLFASQLSSLEYQKFLATSALIFGSLMCESESAAEDVEPWTAGLNVRQAERPLLCFDVSNYYLTVETIARLLKANYNIIFRNQDSDELLRYLNLVHFKLRRSFPDETELDERWHHQVAWHTDVRRDRKLLMLDWAPDDCLTVHFADFAVKLYQLGRHPEGRLVLEDFQGALSGEGLQEPLRSFLNELGHEIITTDNRFALPRASKPLGAFLRTAFLSQLIQFSKDRKMPVARLVEGLAELGWSFAGSRTNWERFIQQGMRFRRSELAPFGAEGLSDQAFSEHVFEINSWKELLDELYHGRGSVQETKEFWNKTAISFHFAIFATSLGQWFVAQGMVAPAALDRFVYWTLGFGRSLVSPSWLMNEFSRPRVIHYVQKFWPNLVEAFHSERSAR